MRDQISEFQSKRFRTRSRWRVLRSGSDWSARRSSFSCRVVSNQSDWALVTRSRTVSETTHNASASFWRHHPRPFRAAQEDTRGHAATPCAHRATTKTPQKTRLFLRSGFQFNEVLNRRSWRLQSRLWGPAGEALLGSLGWMFANPLKYRRAMIGRL